LNLKLAAIERGGILEAISNPPTISLLLLPCTSPPASR
jgi:hypothetical protein